MSEEQWGIDDSLSFTQAPANMSSFDEGRTPCRGKGRGTVPYNNNTNSNVGNYNNGSYKSKQTDEDNFTTHNDDFENDKFNDTNSNKFGGNNRRGNDRPRYGNNRDDDRGDRRWQGRDRNNDRRNRDNDGENQDNGYRNNRRDRPRRDRDDNRGERNGGGYGRNRGDDDNRGERSGGGYGRNRRDDDNGDSNDRGRRRNDDESGNDKDEEPKKREIYIPPEHDNDNLFGNDVSMGINFDKYDDIEVKVTGENAPQPIQSFEKSGLRSILLDNIKKSGYTKPTPVQKYAIPIIMSGRDLMACAQTGSGKTAAFIVPIIHTLLESPRELIKTATSCEPQAIIVSPTRELTTQIFNQAKKFSLSSIISAEQAYGGTSTRYQSERVLRGCHILVATPGRLLDFIG